MPSGSTGHRRGPQGSLVQSPVDKDDGAKSYHFSVDC